LRLQQIVLPSNTKVALGYRKKGGFIGDFEEDTNEPRPVHISAKWQDLEQLMKGLIDANEKLIKDDVDAVVVAAIIAFGFVFIHPFIDGNGRIHRYIIHHILSRKEFTPEGVIFPVSSSIEKNIVQYSRTLEAYSQPILDYVKWETTKDKNFNVLNDTIDYYRYFDATHIAEYLYACIEETIKVIIPHEISMIRKFDEFKMIIEEEIGLPDNKIKLLNNLLLNNNGRLSKIKRDKFFDNITDEELKIIESTFSDLHA